MALEEKVPKANFGNFPAEHVVETMLACGAFAFQDVFTPKECVRLLNAIHPHESRVITDPALTGRLTKSGIRSGVIPLTTEDYLMRAMREIERSIVQYFSATEALPAGFEMTMPGIQIYPSGCAGLPPHRDLRYYKNLVLNLTLAGETVFTVQNRRSEPISYPVRPGTLVAMAAPGFCGRMLYPLHHVGAMPEGRVILVLRQRVPA